MQMPFCAEDELVAALEFVAELSATTALCEKSHSSGSLLMQGHAKYGSTTLALRSLVCQAKLLCTRSPVAQLEMKLESQVAQLFFEKRYNTLRETSSAARVWQLG